MLRDFLNPPQQVQLVKIEPDAPVDKALKALDRATEIALSNVPRLEVRTLVVVDESGSMTWDERPIDIAALFAAVILKANPDADLMMFSGHARYVSVNMDCSLLSIQQQIALRAVAGGTNFHDVFDRADKVYGRIVILSDMQGWMPDKYASGGAPTKAFANYRKRTGGDPHVYSFDLQGYGTVMFPERNVYGLSGFSEKVFDIMALLEQDRDALVHEIESVQLV
jgi:60 kDa SS-A/Ro ribonucleoprotein